MPPAPTPSQARRFRRFGIATLVLVYLVIVAGGIVRMTGSGMGCPDWPKCFGQWVPPTDVSQLPADYQTRYAIPGHVPEFNAAKTWTEYLNRLVGALAGVAVFGTLVFSLAYWRTDKRIVLAALVAFLLMGFQGWLGAQVVSLVLAPWIVTLHMLVALVIVGVLIYAVLWPQIPSEQPVYRGTVIFIVIGLVATLAQIALGTQVREAVDHIAEAGATPRSGWVEAVGGLFITHRTFSWVVLLSLLGTQWPALVRGQFQVFGTGWMKLGAALTTVAIGTTLAAGIALAWFDFPAWAQPVHLVAASVVAGSYMLWLLVALKNGVARAMSQPSSPMKHAA